MSLVTGLPPMLSGEELKKRLEVRPAYDEGVRLRGRAERLMSLNDIYSVYLPSVMSEEVYSKIYLAMLRSLQKKEGKLAVRQRNENGRQIRGAGASGFQGIIGGSDSFSIIGSSGIGKSSAISRAIHAATENKVIELENPFCQVIPAVMVQCPFDCSVKGLLLQILREVDMELDTHYCDMAVRSRATTDMLIGNVSQIALNHIGLLVVDEIQNIVNHRQGKSLVGMLTQLINNSGISICLVGTPEAEVFFEEVDYLARRALGLRYGKSAFDNQFKELCDLLFSYQYVREESVFSDSVLRWLYEHSAGLPSALVSLIHDAQEIAILSGRELLDIEALNRAYEQRMSMMHSHIRPAMTGMTGMKETKEVKEVKKRMAGSQESQVAQDAVEVVESDREAVDHVSSSETVIHLADKADQCCPSDWTFIQLAEQAKKGNKDMLSLLKGKISITEVAV